MYGSNQRVVITDLRIPFFRLVLFWVKLALAAMLAAVIVGFVVMLLTAVLTVAFSENSFLSIWRWRS